MIIPDSFMKMTRAFHQDIGLIHQRFELVYDSAVGMVPVEERADLRRFLDELLDATPSVREHVWGRSNAEVGFRQDSGLVQMLRDMRDRM